MPGPAGAAPGVRARVVWPLRTKLVVLGGAALLLLGSVLPWAKAELSIVGQSLSETTNGLDGDGVITLVIAVVVGVVFLAVPKAKVVGALVLAGGVITGLVAVLDIVDVGNKADDMRARLAGFSGKVHADATVGLGLWLVAVAAVVLLVGGVLCLTRRDDAPAA